jgi:hypothetical protein
VESLTQLRERREFECRLTPDRALESPQEAEAFLRDRWLLTRTPDSALPSLYEACHEDPYRPGSPGFASWPATKWLWYGELAERGYILSAVHRGKNLIVSADGARLLDPICRAEITRMRAADRGWARLLDHLAAVGPSLVDDLVAELRLKRQELKALRAPLERCGAVVSRSVEMTSPEEHSRGRELMRWDHVYQGRRGPKVTRRRRSAISWSPACGQRCSRRNLSCAAGSPGPGTGPTRWSISSSGPDGCARPATGWSLRSLRADRPALARGSVPGMPGDRQRWNARYGGGFIASFLAHPIAELALSLPLPDGPVLDLASGPSGAALLAAATGRPSVAVDVSDVALSGCSPVRQLDGGWPGPLPPCRPT